MRMKLFPCTQQAPMAERPPKPKARDVMAFFRHMRGFAKTEINVRRQAERHPEDELARRLPEREAAKYFSRYKDTRMASEIYLDPGRKRMASAGALLAAVGLALGMTEVAPPNGSIRPDAILGMGLGMIGAGWGLAMAIRESFTVRRIWRRVERLAPAGQRQLDKQNAFNRARSGEFAKERVLREGERRGAALWNEFATRGIWQIGMRRWMDGPAEMRRRMDGPAEFGYSPHVRMLGDGKADGSKPKPAMEKQIR